MESIFISYAHADREFVHGLASDLDKADIPVWYDKSLRGGQPWPRELAAQIEGASALVVVVTPASKASAWVLEEITYAKQCRIQIIPYWHSGDLFFGLTSLQAVRNLADLLAAFDKPLPPPPAPNPFVPLSGRITDPAQVYDRQTELRDIHRILKSGGGVALIGESGIGKSSLLMRLCAQPPDALRQPVYINLAAINNDAEFYKALCERMGIANCDGFFFFRALEQAGRRYLLCLDEAGKMAWKGFTRNIRDQLRACAEGTDAPLKLVLAAPEPLDRLFADSTGPTSPLAGLCLEVQVRRWDEPTCRAFLAARLAGTPVSFPDEQIAQLLETSDGHPQALMRAANALYEQLTGGGI